MTFSRSMNSTFLRLVITLLCSTTCFARPKELGAFYKIWKPLDLVRGLRALSVDPLDVFRALEAVKTLDSEEALDAMHDLDVRPITIYDALSDLGVDPFDAYYALKSWLTDPLLHQPGDHYHRVNISGDPLHPVLHTIYKKAKDAFSDEYKPFFMTSKEIESELEAIEKAYKDELKEDRFRMKDFINKAKEIHTAFDDPMKVFNDFFGDRHFDEWMKTFPEAFKGLKDIYKNPLGFGLKKDTKPLNQTTKQDTVYQHLHKAREFLRKEKERFADQGISQGGPFGIYNDPTRYVSLRDETHTEKENVVDREKGNKTFVYHTKVFYDKLRNMYIECKATEEYTQTDEGVARKVKTQVKHFDPKTYEQFRNKTNKQQQQQQSQQPQQQPQQPQQQPQQPQQQPQQQQQQQQQPQQPQQQPQQQQQQQQQPQQPPQQQQKQETQAQQEQHTEDKHAQQQQKQEAQDQQQQQPQPQQSHPPFNYYQQQQPQHHPYYPYSQYYHPQHQPYYPQQYNQQPPPQAPYPYQYQPYPYGQQNMQQPQPQPKPQPYPPPTQPPQYHPHMQQAHQSQTPGEHQPAQGAPNEHTRFHRQQDQWNEPQNEVNPTPYHYPD